MPSFLPSLPLKSPACLEIAPARGGGLGPKRIGNTRHPSATKHSSLRHTIFFGRKHHIVTPLPLVGGNRRMLGGDFKGGGGARERPPRAAGTPFGGLLRGTEKEARRMHGQSSPHLCSHAGWPNTQKRPATVTPEHNQPGSIVVGCLLLRAYPPISLPLCFPKQPRHTS